MSDYVKKINGNFICYNFNVETAWGIHHILGSNKVFGGYRYEENLMECQKASFLDRLNHT